MLFDLSALNPRTAYHLLIGLVAPRPVALVTTLDARGRVNAAPFSAYNYASVDPPVLALGIAAAPEREGGQKDTTLNIRHGGDFVVNVVDEALAPGMNVCGIDFPHGVSELEAAGLTAAPSTAVKAPRIAEAPASLECRLHSIIPVGGSNLVLGSVVAVHVRDQFVDPAGPYIRAQELHAVGRMNGLGGYVRTRDAFFHMPRRTLQQWLEEKDGGKA